MNKSGRVLCKKESFENALNFSRNCLEMNKLPCFVRKKLQVVLCCFVQACDNPKSNNISRILNVRRYFELRSRTTNKSEKFMKYILKHCKTIPCCWRKKFPYWWKVVFVDAVPCSKLINSFKIVLSEKLFFECRCWKFMCFYCSIRLR